MSRHRAMTVLAGLSLLLAASSGAFAALTHAPASPEVGQMVTFTLSPPPAPTLTVRWNFGDGTPVETATVASRTHVYARPGTFAVTVTLVSPIGLPRTETDRVIVRGVRSVTFVPALPATGQPVAFQAVGFAAARLRWSFGDGTPLQTLGPQATHAFAAAGSFTVTVWDNAGDDPAPISVTVRVSDPRRLTSQPAQPRTGETVSFTAQGFLSPSIRWDFGDGTAPVSGGPAATHAFTLPGTFTVRALDFGGAGGFGAAAAVTVVNPRAVTFTPPSPRAGQAVAFSAQGFVGPALRWDFGDGAAPVTGGFTQTHTFSSPGTFTVTVSDFSGDTRFSVAVPVAVVAAGGPLAPFSITGVLLYFEGQKTQVEVGQGFSPLPAFAEVKFEGTGTLAAEWLVDGAPFQAVTKPLSFAKTATLTTGTAPGLPTQILGPHDVTLRILQPGATFRVPTIRYTVAAAKGLGPVKTVVVPPAVTSVAPDSLERGKEYDLVLTGSGFTSSTSVSFGTDIAAVSGLSVSSPTKAGLRVFVPPTAKLGTRAARAQNEHGASNGPGQVAVTAAKPAPAPAPAKLACTDLAGASASPISLQSPAWVTTPVLKFDPVHGVYQQGAPEVRVPVVDDFSLLKWSLAGTEYESLEVRFFRAKTGELLLTKTLPGSQQSLDVTGDLIAELFSKIPAGPPVLSASAAAVKAAASKSAKTAQVLNLAPPGQPPTSEQLFSQGLKAADILWQVGGISRYLCAFDSSANTPKQFNQAVQTGVSDLWMFELPMRPTGIACAAPQSTPGPKPVSTTVVQPFNTTKAGRAEGSITANTDYVGDVWAMQGTFVLAKSPYGVHAAAGNQTTIENLFLDWGDGSPAQPFRVQIVNGADSQWNSGDKVRIVDTDSAARHAYGRAGSFTIRIFQLSMDDIQQPVDGFGDALAAAVNPGSSPGGAFFEVAQNAGWKGPSSGPNVQPAGAGLSAALDRALLLFCGTVEVADWTDLCATGPLNLQTVEILNFPGHDIIPPGSSQTSGIHINQAALAFGIHALAVPCDEALYARGRLAYFGRGDAELSWRVDGFLVGTDYLPGLQSESRTGLTPKTAADCSTAKVSEIVRPSPDFSPAILGKHRVELQARVKNTYSMPWLQGTVEASVHSNIASWLGGGPAAGESDSPPPGSGPSAEAATAPAGTGAGAGFTGWLADLQSDQAAGAAVPQVGILNPNQQTQGGPAVVYVNDMSAPGTPPHSDAPGAGKIPGLPGSGGGDGGASIESEAKFYRVNEVRDQKYCRILFPVAGGEVTISDFGSGNISLAGGTYSGTGTLTLLLRAGPSQVMKSHVPGLAFKNWNIQEDTGGVIDGDLDAAISPAQSTQLLWPAVTAVLRGVHGHAAGGTGDPLSAVFDLELRSNDLLQASGGASVRPKWTGIAGELAVNGDWFAEQLPLAKSMIGKTGFLVESPSSAVTMDFSASRNPSGSNLGAAGWMGVHIGGAAVTPFTFNLVPSGAFALQTLQEWTLGAGGLNGSSRSGSFAAKIQEGTVGFDRLDFAVHNGHPSATYVGMDVYAPWLETHLKGDAKLALMSNGVDYGTDWAAVVGAPVTRTYEDSGTITLTAHDFLFTQTPLGWCVRAAATLGFTAEGVDFASVPVSVIDFHMDGRARFGKSDAASVTIPLSGSTMFGANAADLTEATLGAPSGGEDRLKIDLSVLIHLSDTDYIAPAPAVVNYRIIRSGVDYLGRGPTNSPFSAGVTYPLGSQEMQGDAHPEYVYGGTGAGGSGGNASAPGGGPWSPGSVAAGGASGDGDRFCGQFEMAFVGPYKFGAAFRLGSMSGSSYYIFHAWVSGITVPLSPIPIVLNMFKGGFGHNFPLGAYHVEKVADASPDMAGVTCISAEVGLASSDQYALTARANLTIGLDGSAQAGLYDVKLLQMGNFGGYVKYAAKVFEGRVFGSLDLVGGLVNFDLGTEANPAIAFRFGGGDWYVYAGRKEGPRISAKVWNVSGCNSYFMLGQDEGLQVGGGQTFSFGSPGPLKAYISGYMDMGFAITPPPIRLIGDFAAGVEAGACVDFAVFEGCLSQGVSATVHAEAPDPTYMKVTFTLDVPIYGDCGISFQI